VQPDRREVVDETVRAIRDRLDQYDAEDPEVKAAAGGRISVRLPFVKDPRRVSRLIRSIGLLEFRLVDFPAGGAGADSRETIVDHYLGLGAGQVPSELEILSQEMRGEDGVATGKEYFAVERRSLVTGRDFKSAKPGMSQFGTPMIEFQLKPEAAEVFGEETGRHTGAGLAIVLDGEVVSVPRINTRIGDRGMIDGRFTQEEIQDLVTVLRSGALPAPVTIIQEEVLEARRRFPLIPVAGAVLLAVLLLVLYTRSRRPPSTVP
jgi:preprotein translocase subunit SecD